VKSFLDFFRKRYRIILISDFVMLGLAIFIALIFNSLNIVNILLFLSSVLISGILIFVFVPEIKKWFKSMPWLTHLDNASFIGLVLGILVLLNLIGANQHFRLDLTQNKLYSLSSQTKQILKKIKEPMNIVFFKSDNELNQKISDVLKEYAKLNKNIILKEYDPDIKPIIAKKYSVVPIQYGGSSLFSTIYIEFRNKTEKVKSLKVQITPTANGRFQQSLEIPNNFERHMTSAILRLQSPPKKIYFLQGHREGDLADFGKDGYSKLKLYLIQENYDIDNLYLSEANQVPKDCVLLIDLSPKKHFENRELEILDSYLKKGGRCFFLLDPHHHSGLNHLTKKWGFAFRNDYVVDKGSPYWSQPVVPFVKEYPIHPIVNNLKSATFFPEASSLYVPDAKGIRSRPLIDTSKDSWSDKDFSTEDKPFFDKEADIKGPVVIMAEFENFTNKFGFKIVASGDSDFVANYAVDVYGNLDLFMNAVNFLADKSELNTIRKKQSTQSIMSLSQVKLNLIFYIFVVLIPLGIAIWGGVILWKKKRKK